MKTVEGFLVSWLVIEESTTTVVTIHGACVVEAASQDEAEGAVARVLREKWPQGRVDIKTQVSPPVCYPDQMGIIKD